MASRRKVSQGNARVKEETESLRIEALNVCLKQLGMKPIDYSPIPPPGAQWREQLALCKRGARETMLQVLEGEPLEYADSSHELTAKERLQLATVLRGGMCQPHCLAYLKTVYPVCMISYVLKQADTPAGRRALKEVAGRVLLTLDS